MPIEKTETLREWFRILKAGGRLQVDDILVEREVPPDELDFGTQGISFRARRPM